MAKLIDKLKKEINKTKPKSKSISFKLREDYVEALEIISKAIGKTKGEIVMQALDEAGLTNEKNLEYFRSVVEEMEEKSEMRDEDEGVSYERKDNEKSF